MAQYTIRNCKRLNLIVLKILKRRIAKEGYLTNWKALGRLWQTHNYHMYIGEEYRNINKIFKMENHNLRKIS